MMNTGIVASVDPNKLFLLVTQTDWNEPPRARHQIAKTLSKYYTVFFLCKAKHGKSAIQTMRITDTLTIIQPYFPINIDICSRLPILNELYQKWVFSSLKKSILKDQPEIFVINFNFTAYQIHRYFKHVIYYCNDEHLELTPQKIFFLPYLHYCERIIINKSLKVITVSKYLLEKKSSDHTILQYTGSDQYSTPVILQDKEEKRFYHICYLGFINKQRINIEWIDALASSQSNYTIELIGPADKHIRSALQKHANIIFHGIKKDKELEQILSGVDVCIIPFKNNRINRPISAHNKLWQYLYFGKPVVTSFLPYLINLPEHFLYVAYNVEEFINKVKVALETDNKSKRTERHEFAVMNSWDNRVLEIIKIFDN